MLQVLAPDQAVQTLAREFSRCRTATEQVPLSRALGRVLAAPVQAREFVPDFDRSTVDGVALRARDTFGCSDSLPALLTLAGEVAMGEGAPAPLKPGECVRVPTGGAVPEGADAAVMVEHLEDYGDGTLGVLRPAAPGENLILRGEDVRPGRLLLPGGTRLEVHHIGALAALGEERVTVYRPPVVGILSTGDELVPPGQLPGPGQIRDVNGPMLSAAVERWGGQPCPAGILPDREQLLEEELRRLTEECDLVVLSGGSSVGEKDAACRVLERLGRVLFHGIAIKPGKPTLDASVEGRPVLGLPGHPVAAFFVARLLLRPLLLGMMDCRPRERRVRAVLTEPVSANHGRAQYVGVFLQQEGDRLLARPARSKSGLITTLAETEGFLCVPRDCEGLPAGAEAEITLYSME